MEKPQVVVRRLLKRPEMTEMALVAELAKLGIKTSQPTINRLRHGKGRPSYDLAVGLNRLHEQLSQSAQPV